MTKRSPWIPGAFLHIKGPVSYTHLESSSETPSEPEESSSSVSLPSVSVPDDSSLLPSSSMAPTSNRTLNWIGIIAWVCIGLGVIVVVIVISVSYTHLDVYKRQEYRGFGHSIVEELAKDAGGPGWNGLTN